MSAFIESARSFIENRYRTPFILCCLVTASFFFVVFVIITRRHSPALPTTLDDFSVSALAIVLTISLMGLKYLIENIAVDRSFQHSATCILTLTHLLAALTLAFTATSFIVGVFPILLALTAECMKRTLAGSFITGSSPQLANRSLSNDALPLLGGVSLLDIDDPDMESEIEEEIEEEFASDCTQRISRFHIASGEAVSGQVRAEFNASERTKAIHVAFCPPFAEKPTAEVFQIAGPAANINQTLVEKFGMRLEIKLAGSPIVHARDHEPVASAPDDVIIEFLVESKKACA